jgi:hypothetical protein
MKKLIITIGCSLSAVVVGYAVNCTLTLSAPCAKGTQFTSYCGSGLRLTYTLYDGQNVNWCVGGFSNGWASCTNEPAVGCVQKYEYSGCFTGTGSITNQFTPAHAVGTNSTCTGG